MAAEKKPTASHRGTDVGGEHLSIEEKYDEVRQLINIGKEKGYLLYDEVNELLPSEVTSSDELDDLFNTFGSAGIEVIDSDQKYLRDEKAIDRTAEGAEELELDLTPGALAPRAEADRRGPQGARGLREGRTEAGRDAARHDDAREAEVSARQVGGNARADRGVAADSRNRVHRSGQAPADRGDEGRRRG